MGRASRVRFIAFTPGCTELPDCFVAVYDFVPGNTLESIMAARGRLPVDESVQAVQDVCEALADMHAHGMVHCDVAPSNVIIAADGAHLIDFGIAKFEFQKSSDDVARFGTWGFAAPEQYGIFQSDERADIFSLGVLLNIMLTGKHPSREMAAGKMGRIVRKCTMTAPEQRYQSARALMEVL